MPLSFELDRDVIRVTTKGDVEFESGLGVLERAIRTARDADPRRRWHLLFDIRESSENRSSIELDGIAGFIGDRQQGLSGRCAVVAGDPFHFGLARQFEAYSNRRGVAVSVFRDVDEALRWLCDPGEAG